MLADINGNLADLRSEAMTSQRFCLRWNNHQSNLLSVFDQLLHDEAFVDVTLAVEGQLLRAHKMVLSACSPYFQVRFFFISAPSVPSSLVLSFLLIMWVCVCFCFFPFAIKALFTGHPDKHPIVILKDVPYVDMRSLLDFMYRGEVSVDQDRLTAFLRVAESLRIKGLTEVNEEKCDLPTITSSLLSNPNSSGGGGGTSSSSSQQPPNLHRINQSGAGGGGGGGGGIHQHHHLPQKRFHHMSNHPLLGSALTAPKRKRGRPRKLSGSSDTPIGESSSLVQDLQSCSDLVQGSPEMMEMKMGIDFQSETSASGGANNSTTNPNCTTPTGTNNHPNATSTPSSASSRKDSVEPTENGTDPPDPLITRVKREPEPTPSTSAQGAYLSSAHFFTFQLDTHFSFILFHVPINASPPFLS